MRRIAVPMIGGMVSSTVLTLIVIPAVYAMIKGHGLPKAVDAASIEKMLESSRAPAPNAARDHGAPPKAAE